MANTRIERVLRHDGIVAVLDWFTEQARVHEHLWTGDDRWHPIVHEAVKLRQISGESSVRVLVGEHAVLVSGDEEHVVGVVFIKGHPVVKSVVRMVRQLLRPSGSSAGPKGGNKSRAARPKPGKAPLASPPPMPRPMPNMMPRPMGPGMGPGPGMVPPMGMPPRPPMGMSLRSPGAMAMPSRGGPGAGSQNQELRGGHSARFLLGPGEPAANQGPGESPHSNGPCRGGDDVPGK